MSPELETLDQLEGGDMPLAVIRRVYPVLDRFVAGMRGLLECGDIHLLDNEHSVPPWQWQSVLSADPISPNVIVSLTAARARRIG